MHPSRNFLYCLQSCLDLFDDRLPRLRRTGISHPTLLRVYHLYPVGVHDGHLEIPRDDTIPLFVDLYQIPEFLIEIILQRPLGEKGDGTSRRGRRKRPFVLGRCTRGEHFPANTARTLTE